MALPGHANVLRLPKTDAHLHHLYSGLQTSERRGVSKGNVTVVGAILLF
jgi:hypothetical protein